MDVDQITKGYLFIKFVSQRSENISFISKRHYAFIRPTPRHRNYRQNSLKSSPVKDFNYAVYIAKRRIQKVKEGEYSTPNFSLSSFLS